MTEVWGGKYVKYLTNGLERTYQNDRFLINVYPSGIYINHGDPIFPVIEIEYIKQSNRYNARKCLDYYSTTLPDNARSFRINGLMLQIYPNTFQDAIHVLKNMFDIDYHPNATDISIINEYNSKC